ncbi:hypothetical protein [Gemmatimonas groenlandica]|uniref:Uncharacterized protein n=1 Tax=Gemmatimonas groenlandica TaxID=2732249 RepID=A0A6M4IJG4_9BACT|nr:hypothetical protein [Gemmatimonas groenlandica]QJR35224.1 hypothetical protein HKW67_06755 [Gemmatimonas groenlandica]
MRAPIDPLKDCIARIGTIRDRWIVINDDTVAPSLLTSIRRILPIPGAFDAIPYRKQADELLSIEAALSTELDALRNFALSEFSGTSSKALASAAIPYTQVLMTVVGTLRQIKARFADALEKTGPRYQWQAYNKDVAEYEVLRSQLGRVGSRFSAILNSADPSELIEDVAQTSEIRLANAIPLFMSQIIAHVNAEAPSLVEAVVSEQMSTGQPKVFALQTDHAIRLLAFAMIAHEMREAKRCLPPQTFRLIEPLTLASIRQASTEFGEAFEHDAKHFLIGYDTAVSHNVNPIFGIAAYFNRILASELGLSVSKDDDSYLGDAVSEVIRRLRLNWWANLSSRATILV